jgi:hypothetical protein
VSLCKTHLDLDYYSDLSVPISYTRVIARFLETPIHGVFRVTQNQAAPKTLVMAVTGYVRFLKSGLGHWLPRPTRRHVKLITHPLLLSISTMASSSYEYIPATATDSRSPCPALNALANHGYLYDVIVVRITSVLTMITARPRDGKNITAIQLISAVTSVYKISYPLAIILSLGGVALDGHGLSLDLEGLCAHNRIEHDASLVSLATTRPLGQNLPNI